MFEFSDYIFVFVLVAFAGFVDSIAGGGGLITVPTYLAVGVPTPFILGTNKLVSTIGTSLSIFRYSKARAINWIQFRWPILFSFAFSFLGASLSRHHTKESMLFILIVVAPLVLFLSTRSSHSRFRLRIPEAYRPFFYLFMGASIGAYDGFFGPGTGSFFLFCLLSVAGLAAREASANARILNYASNWGALLYFASTFQFEWLIAGVGVLGSLFGNYLGSHLVLNHAERVVRPVFILVLLGLIAKLSFEFFGT